MFYYTHKKEAPRNSTGNQLGFYSEVHGSTQPDPSLRAEFLALWGGEVLKQRSTAVLVSSLPRPSIC